jgi:hypothetical protein
MRIAVQCQSPLLQKSLELFLEKYLSSAKQGELIVRDEECLNDKRCFYISADKNADLVKPFSKSQLILALQKRYEELYGAKKTEPSVEVQELEAQEGEKLNFEILEQRIEQLTQEYQANILRTVKAFYEK